MKKHFFHKLKERLKWEAYYRQTLFRRFLWDRLKSSHLDRDLEDACLYSKALPPRVAPDDPIFTKPGILFKQWPERPVYVYHLKKPVLIEPEFGYVIAKPFSIIDKSVPLSEWARSRDTAFFFSGVPSLRKIFSVYAGAKVHVRKEPRVVMMRFVFDFNYFHIFHDVMSRLQVLAAQGIDENIPLVVSKNMAQTKVFQAAIQHEQLAKRTWIVQDDFYIEAEEVIFSCVTDAPREQVDFFLDAIEVPDGDRSMRRRIFLTRSPAVGRALNNMEALTPILEQFHFEIVDTGEMSFEEQTTLFRQAGLVIGIHGAGLTNIIFRRNADLTLVEIFRPDENILDYYALAKLYDFDYDYLIGENPEDNRRLSNFALNPVLLEAKLKQVLGRQP